MALKGVLTSCSVGELAATGYYFTCLHGRDIQPRAWATVLSHAAHPCRTVGWDLELSAIIWGPAAPPYTQKEADKDSALLT